MSKLELILLGRFECLLPSGTRITLSMRKAEVLLAYLALTPGLRHPRERLINLLWSDRGEEQARNSLRQCLSAIKKSLGEAADLALMVDRTTVSLIPELIDIDVHEFERLAAEGDYESLTTAADLYQGEFLEGISIRDAACQEWLDSERSRFKRQFIEILSNLAETQLLSHDFGHAIKSSERLVQQDPLGESGWRLLMRSYFENGDRNHALMAFKRCSDVLHRELGIEPEASTVELQQQIKNGQTTPTGYIETDPVETDPSTVKSAQKVSMGENSILVLPLQNLSNDPDQQYFSDGLTESIITGLSRFPSLRTHSRHSSFAAGKKKLSIQEIGEQFDTTYVVEGSVRRSESNLRISATLANTRSGEQIWGEQFDTGIENTFELEDQITRSIVAAIKGKIDATDEMIAIQKPAKDIESYDLLLRGFHQVMKNNPEDNLAGINLLEQYIENDNDNDLAHLHLYHGYLINWMSAWSHPRPESLEKAGIHVDNALKLAPGTAFNHACYAEYQMFCREWELAETHAAKAIRLNPNDAETLATVCAVYGALGQIDKALELADACLAIEPFHSWINWTAGDAYYSGKRYQDALNSFQNLPNPADEIEAWMAACYKRLGDHENASKHLHLYLEIAERNMACFPQTLDEWQSLWNSVAGYRYPETIDHPFNALCEAGLKDFVERRANGKDSDTTHTIAILPFDNLSGDPEQEYFSDGITDSIILHLSLFPGLNIKSRNSSFAFKQQIKSLGEISTELNVDYIVEGSIRKSEQHIRITVQLIDAAEGNQIWGKRYDAELADLFTLEEELSRAIAATVTGQIESDLQRIAIGKGAAGQQAYDLLLAGVYHCHKITREDMVIAVDKLSHCLQLDPENVRALVILYTCHLVNYAERWVSDPDASFKLAAECIESALTLAPKEGFVQSAYAEYLVFCGKARNAMAHVDKALQANQNDPEAITNKAFVLEMLGQHEQALELAELAQRLDPYHPWVDWNLTECQIFSGQYENALETISNSNNDPELLRIYSIVANINLGRQKAAQQALQELLRDCRKSMLTMPATLDDWLQFLKNYIPFEDSSFNDEILECMVQAGLRDETTLTPARSKSDDHGIAVLPFDNLSGDPAQEYFSDGITESIILNLSLFPGLNVKSRNSSFAFKQQIKNPGEISQELNIDYLVEGSVRKSEDRIRITVQLIEASSGNQVWGKRYDAEIENLLDLEEELSRTIAATVTGQIESDLQRIAINKGAAHQQSYDLLLEGIYHSSKNSASEMVIAIDKLNQCLALDPENARAHAILSYCYEMNWIDRWVTDFEASRQLSREHARKALALDPELGMAQVAYAEHLVFSSNYEEAEVHLKKALKTNPNDSEALAVRAVNLSSQGKFEAALEQAGLALQLDPYHTWARWILSESQFFCGLYEDVLATIDDTEVPPGFVQIYKIAANVRLDRMDAARETLQSFLQHCRESMASMPRTIEEWLAYSRDNAPFADPGINQEIIDYLVQAGLGEEELSSTQKGTDPEALPSILVLPFSNLSGDPEQEYFSDGISESVIVNLSSFSGLNVKSRHTSFAFKNSAKSIEEIAAELDVQYIVEGSIRKFGDKVRITVQVDETASGNQLWGKRFESELEDLFALEEELVKSITGSIGGRIGKDIKSVSMHKSAKDLKSYDYLMRGVHHLGKFNAEDVAIARAQFQTCLEHDPDNSEAHAMLAVSHLTELLENWSVEQSESKRLMMMHAENALQLEPENPLAHAFMAEALMYSGDFERAANHVERALELNPNLPDGYSIKCSFLASTQRLKEALEYADMSLQIDPHHFYMCWNAGEVYQQCGQFERAVKTFRSMPHIPPSVHAQIAASLAGLEKMEEARAEMQRYLESARRQMSTCPANENEWRSYWYEYTFNQDEEDFETFFQLLLKAGLCDEPANPQDDMPSIAVLPFENMSGDPEQEYFSDGITSSLIIGLGLFNGLAVKSQNSSFAFKDSGKSSEEVAEALKVTYLVEGSIRKSASNIRITVQLIESASGNQIWGQQYDAKLDDVLDLEQELSQTIAATISGRIGHKLQQSAARKPAKDLQSYDYLLRGLYHLGKFSATDLEIAKHETGKCLEIDPDNAAAHFNMGEIHFVEALEGWTEDRHKSGELASQHLETALRLEPDNAPAHAYMADYLNWVGDYGQSEFHADKAIELNPTAAEGYFVKADVLRFTRRIEQAIPYADKSLQLDPHSVGAGWAAGGVYQAAAQYDKAIKTFRSISHPPASIYAQIAACFIGLGLPEEARKEMKRYQQLARQQMSSYPQSEEAWRLVWREYSSIQYDEDFEDLFDLLKQAGLCEDLTGTDDDMPSIAVLPFENMSGDPEQEYFSDGITADIISTLSKFKHLRTISRYSTQQYKTQKPPIADIAQQQNARYILEGSVRKSGDRIRVNAELIDSVDGQICWNERYDRDLDDLFAVQDEITRHIALAMKVQLDDGDMALHRSQGVTDIKAWELVMAAVDLQDTYIRQNIVEARAMANEAIKLDPAYAYAWVALAWTYWQEAYSGWSESVELLIDEAENANRQAMQLDPDYGEVWSQAGLNHIMRHEPEQAIEACRKAVELEPGNAEVQALAAFACIFNGDYEQGHRHYQNVLKLCPIRPNWYYLIGAQLEKIAGNLDRAVEIYQQGIDVEPDSPLCRFYLIDVMCDKGDQTSAHRLADEIRALDKEVTGRGLVQAYSYDQALRDRFLANLEQFDLL